MKVAGVNAAFGVSFNLAMSGSVLVGTIAATGVCVRSLFPPSLHLCSTKFFSSAPLGRAVPCLGRYLCAGAFEIVTCTLSHRRGVSCHGPGRGGRHDQPLGGHECFQCTSFFFCSCLLFACGLCSFSPLHCRPLGGLTLVQFSIYTSIYIYMCVCVLGRSARLV